MSSDFEQAKEYFAEFCKIIKQLRTPETGCPWDLKQTHESLAKNMIEEAYEACTAMKDGSNDEIREELGDVLLQVVLNSQLANDANAFTIADVINDIKNKIIRRHPHVFGNQEDRKKRGLDQILTRWDDIKEQEKKTDKDLSKTPYLYKKLTHKVNPATTQSLKIGKACKKVGFEWNTLDEILADFKDEVDEFEEEYRSNKQDRKQRMYDELGDIYFSLAQICRRLDFEPELVAHQGNTKFTRRFSSMEQLLNKDGIKLGECSLKQYEKYWAKTKALEAGSKDQL